MAKVEIPLSKKEPTHIRYQASQMGKTEKNKRFALEQAALFALGWIISKHGITALPAEMLAKALKGAGNDSDYLDEIILACESRVLP